MSWSDALAMVVRLETIPYGYTLAIWSAGAICIGHYGWPKVRDVLLFVGGAVLGYLGLVALMVALNRAGPPPQAPLTALASLNLAPLVPALVVALAVKLVHPRQVGYFLTGLLATLVYTGSLVALVHVLG